ncbi:MAG: hypothetical protein SO365_05980, partial [Prevotella sp.]|nr:hypothetical protein [Prevotella sp.]
VLKIRIRNQAALNDYPRSSNPRDLQPPYPWEAEKCNEPAAGVVPCAALQLFADKNLGNNIEVDPTF